MAIRFDQDDLYTKYAANQERLGQPIETPAAAERLGLLKRRKQGGQGSTNNAAGQGATAIEAQGGMGKENFLPQQTPLRKPGTFTSEEIRMRRLPNVEDVNRPAQNEFRGGGSFSVLPSRSDSTVEGNVAAIESAIQGEREMKAAKRAAQWQSLPENQRGRPPADVAEYLGLSVTPRSNEVIDSSAGYAAELAARNAGGAKTF